MSNNNRGETSLEVHFEYTGKYHHQVPNDVTHVRIHSSVTEIEDYAFYNRRRLKEVVFNDGLRQIGQNAFRDCISLQRRINIPSTTNILPDAFRGCSNLRVVAFKKIDDHALDEYTLLLQSFMKLSMSIAPRAFQGCTNLRELILKEGLQTIWNDAFSNCKSLQSIVIPSTVIEIKQDSFQNCTNLREVVIHNEDIQIEDKAFSKCTSLERFKFPGLSTRLDNIVQAGQRGIEAKMDDITAVEWQSGGELIIPIVHRQIESRWRLMPSETVVEIDYEKLNKIVSSIRYYEMKEATTLFELALWKARIDLTEVNEINRDECRVEVPGPVKDTILQYL